MAHQQDTTLAHAGAETDPNTGAVISPLHLSTTFVRDGDGGYARGYSYTRGENPNRAQLEQTLAKLEGGAAACAFGSGMAAVHAVLGALQTGDHVIMPTEMYHGVRAQLAGYWARWQLQASFVDMADVANLAAAIRPNTKLIWIETPSNPKITFTDIAAVCQLAAAQGIPVCADNTFATPLLQNPLGLGCQLVMHSTTKYMGGHSDVLGGAIVAKTEDDFFARVRDNQVNLGGVPSPFDCWLVLRGLRSMGARLRVQQANAMALAQYLAGHPQVARVHYPGLKEHSGHALALTQMRGFGAMLSFEVLGTGEAAKTKAFEMMKRLQLITQATSLGGTESLIEHRASIEGAGGTSPQGLLRVSVGLEHIDDLVADLAQALG